MSFGGWFALILSTLIDAAVLGVALFLWKRLTVLGRERLVLAFVATTLVFSSSMESCAPVPITAS